jgi:hypothetical protein
MKLRIIDSTDRQYLGHEFYWSDKPIELAADVTVFIDRVLPIPGGFRFVSSNYIIDAQEVE